MHSVVSYVRTVEIIVSVELKVMKVNPTFPLRRVHACALFLQGADAALVI